MPNDPLLGALVVVPTYNEVENLETLVADVLTAASTVHLLIVDDNSPDGTGALADALAATDERIKVLHRPQKNGLGAAYVAGFRWGLDQGYTTLVEMDADGSHPAAALPALLAAAHGESPRLAIGSRWVTGGSVVDWPRHRELLSRAANFYARAMLGIPVHDSTAGFRAYSSEALQRMHLEVVHSHGYCFQIDMTLRALDIGATVTELPIRFKDRERGASKMSGGIIVEAMWRVTVWGVARRSRHMRARERARDSGDRLQSGV